MTDWSSSMQQRFEYYVIDPSTWKEVELLHNVKSCTVNRESSSITRGSATIDADDSLGECYIRVYLITIQNEVEDKHPLGTYIIQTPSSSFNGKIRAVTMDSYTPLLELKDNKPPFGYSILKNENIMEAAYILARGNARAPVIKTTHPDTLVFDYVANVNDDWLVFLTDLVANVKYTIELDELGRVLFAPKQDIESLQPVWTFDDGNSSILYSDITVDHDLYGIPNVVEVLQSNSSGFYFSRVVNDDPNSPTSIISRGREILHRVSNPEISGNPTQEQLDEYAEIVLKELSSLEYTISYTHGYCPVRVGDCVRFNYERAGIMDIKGKVVSQTIKCEPGCPVTEKAVFTTNLWR